MIRKIRLGTLLLTALTLFIGSFSTWAEEDEIMRVPAWQYQDPARDGDVRYVTELIVSLKPSARRYVDRHYEWPDGKKQYERDEAPMSPDEVHKLSREAGITLTLKQIRLPKDLRISEGTIMNSEEAFNLSKKDGLNLNHTTHLLKLPTPMTPAEARSIADKIAQDPDIEYVEPNLIGHSLRVPNDSFYQDSQWNLQQSVGGVNLPPAWDTDIGGTNVFVAVLDTGILPNHADLIGRTAPGYDFVSDLVRSGDGDGPDADPTDPGTWVVQSDITANPSSLGTCVLPPGETLHPSSWHGTHVSGIVGASSNNSLGVAGANWISKILPVRVIGKCDIATSDDVAYAIQWAAGISVTAATGAPNNTNPAKVINLSLGGTGSCPASLQTAINAAASRNAVVVVAAGNSSADASNTWPANCAKVVTVGAVDRQGGQSSFSNFGSVLSLSAPGGADTGYSVDRIKSTGDSGTTYALNDNAYIDYIGTSQATPHVAGIASLMLSARSKLTFTQIRSMLQKTARTFPTGTGHDCSTSLCGAGILDAAAAVAVAESDLSGGAFHSVALQSNGSVVAWGYNGNGQLGDGSALGTIRSYPGPVTSLSSGVISLAAGPYHNVSVKADGTVWTWGYNGYGQLGNGTYTDENGPVMVSSLSGVIDIAAGDEHTLALKADGTVWAWGYNFFGQLGDGTYTDQITPVQVSGLNHVVAIAAGGKRSMALKDDGTVWMWGAVSNVDPVGGTASVSNIPLQMPGISDVIAIAAAGDATTGVNVDVSLALESDGTVWAWGYNDWGQLGNGTLNSSYLPVQVSGLNDVVAIATGGYHSMAVKSDGTVWAWGYNGDGELGEGTTAYVETTPVQTVGLNNVVSLAAGVSHSIALNADLTVVGWGADSGGQLGDGGTTDQNAPIATHSQDNTGTYNTGSGATAPADLSVNLTASSGVQVGGTLIYNFTTTNFGTGSAANAVVTLALAGSVNVVSTSGACTQASGTIVCNLGTLASGSAAGLQVTVNPTEAGTISATAYVDSDSVDPNPANNSASTVTTISAPVVVDSDIPTLPQWGIILMGSLLLATVILMKRREGHALNATIE